MRLLITVAAVNGHPQESSCGFRSGYRRDVCSIASHAVA